MRRTDSFEKTLMLGKVEGRRRRGWQRMRWLDGITDSMDMSFEQAPGVGDSNHLILCHPLLLLPSVFLSIRVFSSESILRIRWPKYWSFSFSTSHPNENIQGWFPLGLMGLFSLQSKEFSRVFSSTTDQKHQFFSTQLSLWSKYYIHTWLQKNHSLDYMYLCWQSNVSTF